jgi:large subunit ribosomal protein L4
MAQKKTDAAEKAAPKRAKAEKAAAPAAAKPASGRVDVLDADNKKVGEVGLAPEVFGVQVNDHLLYEAVKQYRASARRGTHQTKNRANVSGTGKKPWKQKGTGRARVGETRNPLWRHGGTVFGPQPRDYSWTLPKKARAAALRSALSQRASEGALKVVDGFALDGAKTKALRVLLTRLGVAGKAVVVDHEPTDALVLSGRNLPDVKVVADTHLTPYDVLDCKHLLLTREALSKLEERLAP